METPSDFEQMRKMPDKTDKLDIWQRRVKNATVYAIKLTRGFRRQMRHTQPTCQFDGLASISRTLFSFTRVIVDVLSLKRISYTPVFKNTYSQQLANLVREFYTDAISM